MRLIDRLLINPNTCLRDALAAMSDGACNVLLFVDDAGRLRRTVTDGDLRRALLAGHDLDADLGVLPEKAPKIAELGSSPATVLALMNAVVPLVVVPYLSRSIPPPCGSIRLCLAPRTY